MEDTTRILDYVDVQRVREVSVSCCGHPDARFQEVLVAAKRRHHQISQACACALNCLANSKGNTVLFVGEGCTGSDDFHTTLQRRWEVVEVINIPQWFGMHDRLYVFRRRSRNGKPLH